MAFLNLPKVQISDLQSFDIQRNSFSENISAQFLRTGVNERPPNIVNGLGKLSVSEHGFQWPITISVAGKSIWWHSVFSTEFFLYIHMYVPVRTEGAFCEFAGFYCTAGMQKKKRVGPACFFATKRIFSRLASMQADPLGFSRQRTPQQKKSGGLGVNKRNRGYPAEFEFIERPPNHCPHLKKLVKCTQKLQREKIS